VFPPQPPPRTPAEKFVAILLRLGGAVDTKRMFGPLPAPLPVVVLIMARIREIREHVRHLLTRIAAGTYKPRRSPAAPRRKSETPRPWHPSPLPTHFNWLEPLIPQAQQARAALASLFRDPEMLALVQAAPGAMRRPLRSLCRMIGLKPPPVLALPPRPRRPRTTEQAGTKPQPPSPPHRTDPPPGLPRWMLSAPPGKKSWFPAELYDPPEPETT
jgi:hypothetical protein